MALPPLFSAIVVVELPAMRGPGSATAAAAAPPVGTPTMRAPGTPAASPAAGAAAAAAGVPAPVFALVMPHGDPARLPALVLSFCFPDLEFLARMPLHYEHAAEEFVFTLTPRDAPRVHGFVRRYRVGAGGAAERLDVAPAAAAAAADAATPAYQAICILSERPYHRFFSQCLQLLHACRLAGGPVAQQLASTLLKFNSAAPGATIPLRSLLILQRVPGSLGLPKERLRLPPAYGLPLADVPLTPLLTRLDAPALLMLYTALLCERRIVFVAQSPSTLTACVHAALALLQPAEWSNIFIPILASSFLAYCTAPNPYVIGLTPAQFTQLNDEYEIGDIVLVALDEGYVACLNSALPLVDMEGVAPANANTGYLAFSGPRAAAPTAAGLVLAGAAGAAAAAAAAAVPGEPGTGAAMPPPGDDSLLTPFHSVGRTHAYDDDFVRARQQRRVFAAWRLASRRRGKDKIARMFAKPPNMDAIAHLKATRAAATRAAFVGDDFFGAWDAGAGAGAAAAAAAPPAPDSAAGASGWGHFVPDAAAAASAAAAAAAASARAPPTAVSAAAAITEAGVAEAAAAARKPTGGTTIAGGIPEVELDGSLAEEIGMTNLGVDLKDFVSRPGDEDAIRKRRAAAARRLAALPPELTAGMDVGSGGGVRRDAAKGGLAQRLAFSKMTTAFMAMAGGGGGGADDPCAQFAAAIRKVYERERREGAFDEAAVYAATLAFLIVVFGRAADFVHRDADAAARVAAPRRPGEAPPPPGADLRFAKEEFVRFCVRHATVARLVAEAQHAQWLQGFAVDLHMRHAPGGGATNGVVTEAGGRVTYNIVDLAMAEAAAGAAAAAASTSSLGVMGYGGSVGRGGSSGGSTPPPAPRAPSRRRWCVYPGRGRRCGVAGRHAGGGCQRVARRVCHPVAPHGLRAGCRAAGVGGGGWCGWQRPHCGHRAGGCGIQRGGGGVCHRPATHAAAPPARPVARGGGYSTARPPLRRHLLHAGARGEPRAGGTPGGCRYARPAADKCGYGRGVEPAE